MGCLAEQRCALRAEADLLAALDALVIEHLDVDASRTVVLYWGAVLDLHVVEDPLVAGRAGNVASRGH